VDIDPVAVAHSRAMLVGVPGTAVVQGDARRGGDPGRPEVRELIDFDQPVAVMLVAVLHFVSDAEDPAGAVAALRAAVPSGSYVAISHATYEGRGEARVQELYERSASQGRCAHTPRSPRCSATSLVEPGLVYVPLASGSSRTDRAPERFATFAGVGRKP
jgi:hypothetical protein